MSYIGKVSVGGSTHLVGSALYGVCDTADTEAAKVVVCSNFDKLISGVTIHVLFTKINSASNPTMNVNNTGAKPIYFYGTAYAGKGTVAGWRANSVLSFTYILNSTYTSGAWLLNDCVNVRGVNETGSYLALTSVPNVTSVGSAPTLGTAIDADDITAWTSNTPGSASVANGVLTFTPGTAASLSYTAKSIPNVTSVGSAPTLGTAITVATGQTQSSSSGAGKYVLTDVSVF